MNDDNTGKAGRSMIDPEPCEHVRRRRLRWAAPAALALALGWPLGAAAAECDSGPGCLTAALTGLVGGFTGAAGSQLWGWMLGGSQSAGIGQISTELDNIQSTLTTIQNELGPDGPIVKQLQQLGCAGDSDWIAAGPATTIGTLYAYYQGFLADLQAGSSIPFGRITSTNTDVATLYGWANAVIQGDANAGVTTVEVAMNQLYNLTASGTGKGTVFDCVQANTTMPVAGTLDDRPPYETATNIQNYLLNLNTQAMIILTEAYHVYQYGECIRNNHGTAENPPAVCQSDSADDIIANLCPAGSKDANCIDPIIFYGSIGNSTPNFMTYVYAEFTAAGAPLSTDDHLVVNGEGQMLVRSIETYNAAAGADCPDPQVNPTQPCGPTVGQFNFFGPLISYPVGPYGFGAGGTAGTWQVANESLFNTLLDQGFNQTQTQPIDGTVTPGEFLCKMDMVPTSSLSSCTQSQPLNSGCEGCNGGAGLENADKIVLFPQAFIFSLSDGFEFNDPPFACFMDGYMGRATSTQPFCSQQTFDQIVEGIISGPGCASQDWLQNAPNVASRIPYYPNWYEAYYCYNGRGGWQTIPGYLATLNQDNPQGFWWPALPLDSITCDNGGSPLDASNLNPAGLPQLCREKDIQTWFTAIVPPGPTTTTAIADTTLEAAAPNTNDGAGAELKLVGGRHGNTRVALVGFDPGQLQAFLEAGPLDNAQLILTRADTSVGGSGGSPNGKGKDDKSLLVLRPLQDGFVEGNGNVAGPVRGTGVGTTWNCAEDAEIANDATDCLQYWPRGGNGFEAEWGTSHLAGSGESLLFVEDGQGGRVGWDVTEAVRQGVHAWALRVRGSGSLALVSRQGAAALGDPGLAPTLILAHPVKQSVSSNE